MSAISKKFPDLGILAAKRLFAAVLVAGLLGACSAPKKEPARLPVERLCSIRFKALTYKKCEDAILLIDTVYNSDYTDNEARMLRPPPTDAWRTSILT